MPIIRITLLLLLIGVILAFKFLPWYVLVGVAVVLVVGMKFVGKRLVVWLVSMPFRAKGAVLRNATAEVHSITRCEPPPKKCEEHLESNREINVDAVEDEDNEQTIGEELTEPDEPRQHYRLEATISPKPSKGPFHHWEIGELSLSPPDAKPLDDNSDTCRVVDLKVFFDGQFVPDDEGYKLPGPQRLQMILAVKPEVQRLVFSYYFEKFGDVVLPGEKVLAAKS